ncbi:FHA domain-containing protein [uncultured Shewanella sp.]|uniref:FHA domain-containing protein n=1 Tax=uncultured Shewanella sp. TaxID=173975 RepID=UPI00263889DA|nr:FHA domain-containing protein [uncultured Shewanella sp.]
MVLSLHVIFSPKGETLTRLNFTLPEEGGSIGSDSTSTIVLSDSTFNVIPIHAVIKKERDKYFITDMSQSGIYINGSEKKLGYHNELLLSDGDTLDIAGYRLLVSCFSSKESSSFSNAPVLTNSNRNIEANNKHSSLFSSNTSALDLYDDPFTDFDESNFNHESAPFVASQQSEEHQYADQRREFDFIKREIKINNSITSSFVASGSAEPDPFMGAVDQTPHHTVHSLDKKIEPVYSSQTYPLKTNEVCDGHGTLMPLHQDIQERSHSHCAVMELTDIDVMKVKIEGAMQRFLEELSPEYLESMFNDCHIGWRKLKKKDLWGLYSSHFFRMMNSNEFQRKFWAYFCDQ